MKLQGAMEVITKGTFDGPANDNALRERLRGTVARCSELTPIIGIWVALTLLAFLAWLVQAPDKDVKSDDSGGGESVVGDGGELQGGGHAMDIPREFDIGPNFLGGGVLGYGSGSAHAGGERKGVSTSQRSVVDASRRRTDRCRLFPRGQRRLLTSRWRPPPRPRRLSGGDQ